MVLILSTLFSYPCLVSLPKKLVKVFIKLCLKAEAIRNFLLRFLQIEKRYNQDNKLLAIDIVDIIDFFVNKLKNFSIC